MLAFHPVTASFPMMSDAAFAALLEDLAQNGQKKAIALFEGKIWDGRTRALACERLGIEPRYRLLKRKDEPTIYLIERHNRYGAPLSPERNSAIKILHQIWSTEWIEETKKRKAEWLAAARAEFKSIEKKWRPCDVCKQHINFVQAHHRVPLSIQFELGLEEPVHDHDWLCPVHHRIVHIFIGIYITRTRDGTLLDHVPDHKVEEWNTAEQVFMRGHELFESLGGTSQNGSTWGLFQP